MGKRNKSRVVYPRSNDDRFAFRIFESSGGNNPPICLRITSARRTSIEVQARTVEIIREGDGASSIGSMALCACNFKTAPMHKVSRVYGPGPQLLCPLLIPSVRDLYVID